MSYPAIVSRNGTGRIIVSCARNAKTYIPIVKAKELYAIPKSMSQTEAHRFAIQKTLQRYRWRGLWRMAVMPDEVSYVAICVHDTINLEVELP